MNRSEKRIKKNLLFVAPLGISGYDTDKGFFCSNNYFFTKIFQNQLEQIRNGSKVSKVGKLCFGDSRIE